jgi:hypothetical protein
MISVLETKTAETVWLSTIVADEASEVSKGDVVVWISVLARLLETIVEDSDTELDTRV